MLKDEYLNITGHARQEWNRTAEMALVSGIEEAKTLEIKQAKIHDKVSSSIRKGG